MSRLSRRLLLTCLLALAPPRPAVSEQPSGKAIDINAASAAEFEKLPGVGPVRALLILRMREVNGPFRGVEELRALPRLS